MTDAELEIFAENLAAADVGVGVHWWLGAYGKVA